MTVTKVEILKEASANDTPDGTEYRVKFAITSDNPLDGPGVILSSPLVPARASVYDLRDYGCNDFDSNVMCKKRDPQRDVNKRTRWYLDCTWSPPDSGEAENATLNKDGKKAELLPIDRTKITMGYTQYNEPIRDAIWLENLNPDGTVNPVPLLNRDAGELGPIVNTALEPFIPAPEQAYAYTVIRLSRVFEAYGPFFPPQFDNDHFLTPKYYCPDLSGFLLSVNTDPFCILGNDIVYDQGVINAWLLNGAIGDLPLLTEQSYVRGGFNFCLNVPAYCSFVNDISIEPEEEKPYTGRVFQRVTVELWIDRRRTFRRKFRSVGFVERRMPGDPDPDEPGGTVSLGAWPFGKKAARITDERGHPTKTPVDLDVNGQDCRRTGLPVAYLRFRPRSEMEHKFLIDTMRVWADFRDPPPVDGIIVP